MSNSFANQVTAGARAERRVLTPMQREINGMIRLTLLVAAFLMVVLTISAVAWRDPFVELVQRLVVVIGLVPQGLLLAIVVTMAGNQDRDAGLRLLVALRARFSTITLIWADAGYAGRLVTWAGSVLHLVVEIVKRSDDLTGFHVLPRRWVVERTLAWLNRFRRLAIRYERRADIHEALVTLGCALICLD